MARRLKKDAMETREKLLESALDIMSEKPFPNVTMTEIAEKIGLSKGAIYWHFKNKDDVLVSLIEDRMEQMGKMLCANLTSLESLNDMHIYFKDKIGNLLQNESSLKIHRLIRRRDEWPEEMHVKILAILQNGMAKERSAIERLIVSSQERGTIRKNISAQRLALLIGTIFQGIFILQIDGFYQDDSCKYIDFIFDAFRKELDPTNDTGISL